MPKKGIDVIRMLYKEFEEPATDFERAVIAAVNSEPLRLRNSAGITHTAIYYDRITETMADWRGIPFTVFDGT